MFFKAIFPLNIREHFILFNSSGQKYLFYLGLFGLGLSVLDSLFFLNSFRNVSRVSVLNFGPVETSRSHNSVSVTN